MTGLYPRYVKRILDILLAIGFAITLLWLEVFIILLYMLTDGWPFIYKSLRLGENEKQFNMCKFRTLSVQEELPLKDRRFGVGNFLRFTNLDEFPQLLNVLKGEMSFIGPRPLPVEYASLFSSEQKKRFQIKPGITGWAQVNGRHSISWQKKFELDNYYVDHLSFRLDMIILFKTIVLLLSFRKDNSLQEEKFKGN